jgi:hypothetical protein
MTDSPQGFGIEIPSGAEDEEDTIEDVFGPDPFEWQRSVIAALQRDMRVAGKDLGYSQDVIDGLVAQYALPILNHLDGMLRGWDLPAPRSALHYNMLLGHAKTFFASKSGLGQQLLNFREQGPTGPRGPRKPTADEIRQSFDLDQLSSAVTDAYQGMILDDPKDPRAVARAYVEAIVANPEQKLDFQTFVEGRVKQEPRYQMIYKNKPRGMSDAQFLQPYVQQAMQRLRPQNVAEVSRAGAQLGASPDAFRANLDIQRESQVSAPFITGMERRITELGGVFKG